MSSTPAWFRKPPERLGVSLSVAFLLGSVVWAGPVAPAASAVTSPRLSVVSGQSNQFSAMSEDGAHLLFWSPYDPLTGVSGDYGVWDTIGGRYFSTAPYGSRVTFGQASRDGSAYTFIASAALEPEDVDSLPDLYLHTSAGNRLIHPDIDQPAGATRFVADGGSMAIVSTPRRLTSADTDDSTDDYLWDASTGSVELLSDGPNDPHFQAIAEDGSRIILIDAASRIIQWEAGALTTLAVGTFQGMSADGSRVYVSSEESLVAADTDNAWDAYVLTDGTATLLTEDISDPVWLSDRHISADGSRWILSSTYPLLPGDADGMRNDNYLATPDSITELPGGDEDAYVRAISDDLSTLVLETRSALVAGDVDGAIDLYMWSIDDPGAATLMTSGTQSQQPELKQLSPHGRRAIIETAESLLPESPELSGQPRVDIYEWLDGAITALTPATARDTPLLGVSRDGQRVVFGSSEALIPADVDTAGDLYVSDRDVIPPIATIEGPTGVIDETLAEIEVGTADGDGVFFECRLDAGAFEPCGVSSSYHSLDSGPHEASVRAFDAAANRSEIASIDWVVSGPDTMPPSGAVEIAGGSTYTKSTAVNVSVVATDPYSGVDQVALSNDGTTWTTRPYAATQAWELPSTNGTRTLYAKWRDGAGNWSAAGSDSIVLDTVAPTATAPGRKLVGGSAISGGRTTVRLGWTGSDAGSGIARYELAQSTDGGSWATVSTSLTSASLDRPLAPNHAYRFRVRAVDKAGNTGAWMTGPVFRLTHYGETNSRIRYSGTWATTRNPVYWGGQVKSSRSAGARATISVTGRSVEWVARKGPDRGRAQIYVNGVLTATVDLYASSYQNQRVVWAGNWSTSATRTISIRVLGTSGRPRVDLDAIVAGT